MNAFTGCIKLEEIVIPEGVTKVDSYAFQGCAGLKHISFPSTITSYGASVLYGCINMETITFNAMQAAPLSQERTGQSGVGYIGFDTSIYMATNPPSYEGCLRKENGGQYGHDVVMRHPVGAKGYSDDEPVPTDGWAYYIQNTWETFSNLPEEVQAVIDAINAIDDPVTLDSEDAITAARAAYGELSEDNQALIDEETLKKLTDAEAELDALKVNAVVALINAIGDVTAENYKEKAEAIGNALTAYKALSEAQKASIDPGKVAELNNAVTKKDLFEAIDALGEKIDGLPTDTTIQQDVTTAISGIAEQITALQNKVDALPEAATKTEVETAINELYGKLDTLSKTFMTQADLKIEIGKITEKINAIQNKINTLPTSAVTKGELDAAIDEIKGQIGELKTTVDALPTSAATKTEVETAIKALYGQLETLSGSFATKEELTSLDKKIDDLKEKVNLLPTAAATKEEVEKAISDIATQISALQAKVDGLPASAATKQDVENAIKALDQKLDSLITSEEKTSALQGQIDSLMLELRELKKESAVSNKVNGLKAKAKSRKFTVSWSKNAKAEGYDVEYKLSTAKKFKSLKKGLKATSIKTKALKSGKKYTFRVRPYQTINGEKVSGKWVKKTATCK